MKNLYKKFVATSLFTSALCTGYFACSADMEIKNNESFYTDETVQQNEELELDIPKDDSYENYCVYETTPEVTTTRPVDVIFVIDNSGSMAEEIQSITQNINDHFAAVMDSAGLDYRVIMIVKHGPPNTYYGHACFEEPLSTIPKGGCQIIDSITPPGNNPGKFYHYSYDVQSNDSPCIILDTLFSANNKPDTYGLAPNGWIKWLRESAFKVIIEITDDSPGCWWYPDINDTNKKKTFNDFQSTLGGQIFALEFDKKLTTLAPEQFGTPENRNYTFYSVVGMKEKPDAIDEEFGQLIDPLGKEDDPFLPSEEVVSNRCSTAAAPGFGYQSLSKLTGGLRFPVCQAEKFNTIFNQLAQSIDSVTSTVCSLNLPSDVEIEDPTIAVEVETNNGIVILNRVTGPADCSNNKNEFYVDKTSNLVLLCEETCGDVKSISKKINVTAGCKENIF